jgi:hypothetical protein
MRTKQTARWVKLYFRDQKKIMRAIPNLEGLVVNDVLAKMYTLSPRVLIYQVEDSE